MDARAHRRNRQASTDLAKLRASIRWRHHLYLSKRPPHARIRGGSSTPHDATHTLQPRGQLPPSLQSRRERVGRGRAGRGGEIGASWAPVTTRTTAGDIGGEIGGSWRQLSDRVGEESEREGGGFLTGGGEGDKHLMPLCCGVWQRRGNYSFTPQQLKK